MAVVRFRPELYRWRRFSQPAPRRKIQFDADSVEHWIKRVEQASEFAVSEAFSLKKQSCSQKLQGPLLNLETTEQLKDHDEAFVEAHELLNEWMNSKLKLELAGDQENDVDSSIAYSVPSQEPTAGFHKYEKFDDFYGYLEQEIESTKVQDYLQHLMQSEIVNSGIIEDLKTDGLGKKSKPRDPRIAMELRHKQVKENRLRRQKALELLTQENLLKKSALSEAQKQLQEEQKKKALKAKKEEEEIQKQMVILRKEFVEKRHLMEAARKMERKRHNLKKTQSLIEVGPSPAVINHMDSGNEGQRKEKQDKMQKLMHKIIIADQKCLRKYFCSWCKLVQDLRIKMGKARALADWKCQLKIFRAWRDYSWTRRLEIQKTENQLRDQNRKNQLAIDFNQKRILRHYFVEWQCWSQLQVKKRVLETKKEEMRWKMAKFLEVVSQEQFTTGFSRPNKNIHLIKATQHKPSSVTEVTEAPYVQNDPKISKLERENSNSLETSKKCNLHAPRKPKWAWQVTMKHAALNVQDHAIFGNQTKNILQHPSPTRQKTFLAVSGPMEHRHTFQKQLIEEQRRQLQEQQELIQKLQETQRLHTAWEETKRATAATMALDSHAPKTKGEKQLRENQSSCRDTKSVRSENQQAAAQKRKHLKVLITPHPLLKAMEERAIQRAERKRDLEEAKKRREEEKLAELQAKEEERQKQEAAERQAQLEKRQEEKMLQKMKELEKQRKLEREQQMLSKAEDHYISVLLKKMGLEPWKRLIEQAGKNMVNAERHHHTKLQRKCLLAWLQHVQDIHSKKTAQAEQLYSCQLLRRSFRRWIKYRDYVLILEQKASEFCETALKKKVLRAWFDVVNKEKSVLWEKQKIADQYSNRRKMLLAFDAWRQFPAQMKEEREKEERIGKLRKRVAEILPDFQTCQKDFNQRTGGEEMRRKTSPCDQFPD